MSDARSVQQADEPGWNEYGNWAEGKPLMAGPWFLGTYQPSPEAAEYWPVYVREWTLWNHIRTAASLLAAAAAAAGLAL